MKQCYASPKLKIAFDPVVAILGNSRASELLMKLGFDIRKYTVTKLSFFESEFKQFLLKLNDIYKIYDKEGFSSEIDPMAIYCPWLIDFLEKVLEKKEALSKVEES